MGTWFTTGVILFFYRKFLNDADIGVVEALTFGLGLLAEIPSGTFADKFGRRKTVILGTFSAGIGFAVWGLAVNSLMVFLGILIFSIGTALQSGADEAMMYDYLKSQNRESLWPRISANRAIIARLAFVVSLFIGGIAYIYLDRLPFIMRAATFFLMLIPLIRLAAIDKFQEIHFENQGHSFQHYLNDLKNGMKELFKAEVRWLIPLYIIVQGISYTIFSAGILRPLLYEKSGLDINYHSFAISVAVFLTVLSMLIIRRYSVWSRKKSVVFSLALICVVGFALSIGNLPIALSLFGLTALQVASYSLMPLLSTVLNKNISSRYRATTISTASFMQSIVYIFAAPLIGYLSYKGYINEATIGVTILVAGGIVLSLGLSLKQKSLTRQIQI